MARAVSDNIKPIPFAARCGDPPEGRRSATLAHRASRPTKWSPSLAVCPIRPADSDLILAKMRAGRMVQYCRTLL